MEEKLKRPFVFGWKIIAYLFLAGVGGGAASVGATFHLISPESEEVILAGLILGAPLVLIGSLLLLSDLGRPRIAYRAISKPDKAWISRGTFILTLFIIFGAIQFGTYLWPFQWLKEHPTLHVVLNTIHGIFGVLTLIYTGFLFDTTRSIPFWSTPILPLLFLVSGLSTGLLAILLTLLVSGSSNPQGITLLTQFDALVILFEALIIFLYLHGMHEVTAARASAQRLLKGDLSIPFWIGVILIGLFIPFLFEMMWREKFLAMVVASLCGLMGGVYIRYVIVSGAVKEPIHTEGVFIPISPRPE